jgi:hypothetical protein
MGIHCANRRVMKRPKFVPTFDSADVTTGDTLPDARIAACLCDRRLWAVCSSSMGRNTMSRGAW